MKRDQYLRATALFEELKDLPVPDREGRLASMSQTEPELHNYVQRLLEADVVAEHASFMQHGAMQDAARLLGSSTGNLPEIGATIGNYRLEARLQAGGMGVVFEGQDLRLDRTVAVKVLPMNWATGTAEAVQRFQREARAISQLNHPNVVSIFDAGFERGHYYIAMEFIRGQNLRQFLARAKDGLDDAIVLDILRQASAALAVAHAAGIVHRDIKPENIMLRNDGLVKVLDFGLAKMSQNKSAEPVSKLLTRPGDVAGTIQYLSPEQVLGKPVDGRSDIFSLGVVAYELATGSRPFDGPTDGAVFAAITNVTPPAPSTVRPNIGGELERIILRSLEKDPEYRFQTAQDLRSACGRVNRDSEVKAPPPPAPSQGGWGGRAWTAATAMGAIAAVAGLLAGWGLREDRAPVAPVSFEKVKSTAEVDFPILLSDGRQVIYQSPENGNLDILLQRAHGRTAVNLTEGYPEDDTQPAVSPDETRIAFRSNRDGGGLFIMDLTGENPRRISSEGYLPTWSPDGTQVAYSTETFTVPNGRGPLDSRIVILNLSDGSARKLNTNDAIQPDWSPHGHRFAYWSVNAGGRRDIFTVAADGKSPPVAVTADQALDWYPVWAPSGEAIYFLSDRGGTMGLWRVEIDERSGQTRGDPEPVVLPAPYVSGFSLAKNEDLLLFAGVSQQRRLESVGFDPVLGTVTGPTPILEDRTVSNFDFSPDGQHIVFDTYTDRVEELWIVRADGTGQRRLISDGFRNRTPAWSKDGARILFFSDRSGAYESWVVRPDGSDLRQITIDSHPHMQRGIWTADGRYVLSARAGGPPVLLDPQKLNRGPEQRLLSGLPSIPRLIFAYSDTKQGLTLMTATAIEGTPEILIHDRQREETYPTGIAGQEPRWLPPQGPIREGRMFLFIRGASCYLYDRDTGEERQLFSTAPRPIFQFNLRPRGRSIFYSKSVRDVSLWLARMK